MTSERVYYTVNSDSPLMVVIQAAIEKQLVHRAAASAFAKLHGTESWVDGGNRVIGLAFKGDVPEGWRARDSYWVPDQRSKLGKAIARRMKDVPFGIDSWNFSQDLGEGYLHWEGNAVHFAGFGQYGDKIILSVSAAAKVEPVGCIKLKMSEYYQILEANEPLQKQVAA